MQTAINYYPWEISLAGIDVNIKVYIFAKTIKTIFSNTVSHQIILCDDRDPPWISNKIKNLANDFSHFTAYQSYIQNDENEQSFQVF